MPLRKILQLGDPALRQRAVPHHFALSADAELAALIADLRGASCEVHAGEDRDLTELLRHEIDHLDGILCIDRVGDVTTICTKEEFEKRYRANSPYAVKA